MEPRSEDGGDRALTRDEARALLDRPLVGVFSTLAVDGWIHSVPIHYLVRDDELRIVMERSSVKFRNAVRTGRATVCVETTDGPDRRYVTVEGPSGRTISRRGRRSWRFNHRYERPDPDDVDMRQFVDSVIVVLRPDRWISRSDLD